MPDQTIPLSPPSTQDEAAGKLKLASDRFPIGRRLALSRIDNASMTSIVSDYDRDIPVAGEFCSDSLHFLDLSLSGRPAGAWGRFPDAFTDTQPVGKVLFVPARHRYSGQGGIGRQRSVSVFFNRSLQLGDGDPILEEELEPVLRNCLQLQGSAIVNLMISIGRETREPGFASEFILEGLGLMLMGETARLLHKLHGDQAHRGGLASWRLKLIEDRIRNDGSKASLQELASLCKMSARHLVRAFRQQTGRTIGAFVQQITIERARQLLVETDDPMKVIAAKLGFSSVSAFSTAFRRSTGSSPRHFREHQAADRTP